jgi:hypothetical protein
VRFGERTAGLKLFVAGVLIAAGVLALQPLVQEVGRAGMLEGVGLTLRHTYVGAALLVAGSYWLLSRYGAPGWVRAGVPLMACLWVLAGVWLSGLSDAGLLGGLLPYSDGEAYFGDAVRLLHGEPFGAFSSRRPAGPMLLAGLLAATGGDLRAALALTTGLCALAIWLAVREAHETLGVGPALLLLLCLFLFYRRFIGTCLTEHLGLALGCLACVLLWRGAAMRHLPLVLAGVALLSLGLNARAGAFLVLPAVVAWAAWQFGRPHRCLAVVAAATAAGMSGFVLNGVLLWSVGTPHAAFSNFAYTFYGLVHDGNWGTALKHHPELSALPAVEQAHAVYGLAWAQVVRHPGSLLAGAGRAWADFFSWANSSWTSQVLEPLPFWFELRDTVRMEGLGALDLPRHAWILLDAAAYHVPFWGLTALLLAGLAVACRDRRDPLSRLAVLTWAGTVLSVPFAPPWDAENMRVYAATLPLLLTLPLLGAGPGRPAKEVETPRRTGTARVWPRGAVALTLVFLAGVTGPVLARSVPSFADRPADRDGEGTRGARTVLVDPHNAVHLVERPVGWRLTSRGNVVDVAALRTGAMLRPYPAIWQMSPGVGQIAGGRTVAAAFDLRTRRAIYLEADSVSFPSERSIVTVCAWTLGPGRLRVRAWSCPGEATGPSR